MTTLVTQFITKSSLTPTSIAGTGWRADKVNNQVVLTVDGWTGEQFTLSEGWRPKAVARATLASGNNPAQAGRMAIQTTGVATTNLAAMAQHGQIVYYV